ncbi:hypothetical protein L6452_07973 [Arctium lappa]|uniref:Uncharacterized protein n=1 Tax=Arctium lappa TaxID=4217 RepID=A0ACB9DGG1_ARCLA|nr:hypothetical protein L6452_07973 [Arctium lappa]
MEEFRPLPRPADVVFIGAEAQGRPLIDIVELSANASHYLIIARVPLAQSLPDGRHHMLCAVTPAGAVFMKGKTPPGSILVNLSMVHKKRRIQLCHDEPWGIAFSLPGSVDAATTQVSYFPGRIELRIQKHQP